jgi:hypothetical protein
MLACFHLLWIEDAAASSYLGGFFFKVLIMDFGCNEMQRNELLCWLNLHSRDASWSCLPLASSFSGFYWQQVCEDELSKMN